VHALLGGYAFAIGAIVGSFLNVVIHRYPREESIVFPPSRCPHCGTAIKPWDNIPILSYLILLGRCRSCRAPISPRYPLVELANALFYLAVFLRTGATIEGFLLAAIISMTIALIFIDADIQILPDVIDIPGIAIGIALGAMHAGESFTVMQLSPTLTDSLIGAAFGAAILLVVGLTYKLIRKIEGMGLGDVKMLAMIGAVTGWTNVFTVLLVASITGAIAGIAVASRHEKRLQVALPFGVFLGIAFLVVIFFGATLTEWYAGLLLAR
jgi:leader peptidase (prepilin peptidase)/N-methyltransferase